MKNKRAILGTIFLAIILALLMLGGLIYLQIRINGLEFHIGNILINLKYSPKEIQESNNISGNEEIINNENNESELNLSLIEDNLAYENLTNSSQ